MRVLHVISHLKAGGAEKLMADLLPRLKERGVECDLLCFDGTKTFFMESLEKKGFNVMSLSIGKSPYSIKNLFKLVPFLKKYDIVHTHTTAPQLFAAIGSVLCSVVLCTTEHNTSNRRRGLRWYAPIDHWMYSRYKEIICISEGTLENLKSYAPNLRCATDVIYNGIPIETYSEAVSEHSISTEFADKFKIVMIARFSHQKDQPTVIKALKHLPDKFHLFLVGDGDKRKYCESLVEELQLTKRVHFLGVRSDVPSILKSADVCVLSSIWEGFGLAAVEGMAAGKPVVASNVSGLANVVGDAGLLFESGDDVQLASKLLELEQNRSLYEKLVNIGKERAKDFGISKMADEYTRTYNNIITRQIPPPIILCKSTSYAFGRLDIPHIGRASWLMSNYKRA